MEMEIAAEYQPGSSDDSFLQDDVNVQPRQNSPRCTETYDETIKYCVSIGLSPNQIMGIINSVLSDQKQTDLTKYVSHSGIRKQIDKVMSQARQNLANKTTLKHVSFDGRRDLQAG